jgi:hypothetical protein
MNENSLFWQCCQVLGLIDLVALAFVCFTGLWFWVHNGIDGFREWRAKRRAVVQIDCNIHDFDMACEIEELERWAEMPDTRIAS